MRIFLVPDLESEKWVPGKPGKGGQWSERVFRVGSTGHCVKNLDFGVILMHFEGNMALKT